MESGISKNCSTRIKKLFIKKDYAPAAPLVMDQSLLGIATHAVRRSRAQDISTTPSETGYLIDKASASGNPQLRYIDFKTWGADQTVTSCPCRVAWGVVAVAGDVLFVFILRAWYF